MVVETSSSGLNKPIFSSEAWNGDPDGEVTLEFENCTWKVKKEIVSARFPWIKKALATTTPVSTASPPSLRPTLKAVKGKPCHCPPAIVQNHSTYSLLSPLAVCPHKWQVSSQITRVFPQQLTPPPELPSHIWEDEPSFYTYVEFYFLAERFGLDDLKLDMVKCVEELARQVPTLTELHCAHCALSREDIEWAEKQHLASFLDAVLAVEEQPWSAKIIKAMYDAGERMKPRLTRLPAFRDFVEEFRAGKDFARAIGVHGRAAV